MAWIAFQKRKWRFQALQRIVGKRLIKKAKSSLAVVRSAPAGTLGGFLQRAQRTLLVTPWQILQICPTATAGEFKLWALVRRNFY